jgi:ATP-binding cassette subfamily C protein
VIAAIRRAFSLLDRTDRARWLALVPLAGVAAALEAAGAASVFLLVRLLAAPGDLSMSPGLVRWLPDVVRGRSALAFCALVVLFYLIRAVVLIAIAHAEERVIQSSASRIAVRLLARYLGAPYAFHFRRSSSALIHAVRDSVDTVVEMVLASAVHIASELLVAAGLLTLLAVTAPKETTAAVLTVIALVIAPVGLTRRLYARWGEAERRAGERMVVHLQQSLDTVKQILVSGTERRFVERYARDRAALERLKVRRALATTSLRLGVETVFVCAMVLAVAMLTVSRRSGPDAVSVLGLFAYAGFRIVPSANRVIVNVNALRYGRSFVDAVAGDWHGLEPLRARAGAAMAPFARAIECAGVAYTYEGAATPAVEDVTFAIPRGSSLGIVGPTGAGKSTIVDIVLGLLSPTAGRVLVDGRDLADVRDAWLEQVGYVPQEVMLVDDTLRRNIAFGVDDRDVRADRLDRAIQDARLESFVGSVPDGLEALVGERGIRLSGGERQRIAIARALYHDPAVLVFDEATSALDPQTEREVADAIDRAKRDRTVIIIAHRLATVRQCDRIVVFESGRVVAQGRYDELLADSDTFRALARSS